jgi:hypothetical protein
MLRFNSLAPLQTMLIFFYPCPHPFLVYKAIGCEVRTALRSQLCSDLEIGSFRGRLVGCLAEGSLKLRDFQLIGSEILVEIR